MVIMAVDPNKKDLKLLVRFLRMVFQGSEVLMFTDSEAAAQYVHENPVDIIYTEVAMMGLTGFGLQKAAEAVQPAILTVFVTDAEVYAEKAIKTRAQGYILKPVTRPAIWESIQGTKFENRRLRG